MVLTLTKLVVIDRLDTDQHAILQMPMNEPRFLEWIRRIRQSPRYHSDNVPEEKSESRIYGVIKPLSQLSQIALVAVAIFGYFYTVQPIYQKERLAEQVAQYEIKIDEQITSIEQAQSELRGLRELTVIEQERSRKANRALKETTDELTTLVVERDKLLQSLTLMEQEKSRIENQIRFMQYRHFLPDGTPAVTDKEVETAITESNRNSQRWSYFSGLNTRGTFIEYDDEASFAFRQRRNVDPASQFYPFTEEELEIWKNHGLGYPRFIARNIIDTTTTGQSLVKISGASYNASPADLETWRAIARNLLEGKEDMWTTPYYPLQLVDDYEKAASEIDEQLQSELQNVELEYEDWEKTRNAQRKVVLEHNYKVDKTNARNRARSAKFTIEWNYREYANKFRKSAKDEIERLLDIEDTEKN